MDSTMGSVSHWLIELRAGDPDAAQRLWQRYYPTLVRLARQRLRDTARRVADEEDAALSAFDSFCRGAARGQFPRLRDRHDLWQVLVMLTARKAIHQRRDQARLKRGGGAVKDQAALDDAANGDGLAQLVGQEPTPEFAAQVAEEYGRLLEHLGEPELRSIALWRMEGHTVAEIAERLGCVPRTVERKLILILRLWTDAGD